MPTNSTSPPTGVVVQGAGAGDAFITAFQLQFSTDGNRWHNYQQVSDSSWPEPKVLPVPWAPACVCVCGEGLHRAVPKCTECPFAASNVMTPCPLPCTCGWVQVCWCTAVHMDLRKGLCMSLCRGVCMGVHMGTCTGVHPGVHPFTLTAALPQLFQGNWDATTPVVQPLGRMVQARYVRILPQGFHNAIFLRAELLGCPTGTLRCAEGVTPPQDLFSLPTSPSPRSAPGPGGDDGGDTSTLWHGGVLVWGQLCHSIPEVRWCHRLPWGCRRGRL